jgi:hypothetical protein
LDERSDVALRRVVGKYLEGVVVEGVRWKSGVEVYAVFATLPRSLIYEVVVH